jgi:hypothetical protein
LAINIRRVPHGRVAFVIAACRAKRAIIRVPGIGC